MGVPAFYRWLSEKYPKIVQDVLEERVPVAGSGSTLPLLPLDVTGPNPSGLECDNLYIDMNGIIHPCSHPEQGPQPKTEEEMYENVCHYVDRLFRVMRPRKLLYLAIDGVAPRAKMNQQRARRFKSAQEARELLQLEEHIRDELEQNGQAVPPVKKPWDSNVITPGTKFMLRLAEYLRFYIRQRISTDKSWQKIRVIFSDASIPGEGEHKIMAHVRLQRAQPGYDPNTVHVLHGLDADLIMLGLATHEAHFYISREEVVFGRKSQEVADQRRMESGFNDAQRVLDEKVGPDAMNLLINQQKPLQRVSIPILREYLAAEFATLLSSRSPLPFAPSLERLIDDFVFLCFFVGNDFLPHLPSLDIRDGGLDYLLNVYKRVLPGLGDYITGSGGKVNLSQVDVILAEVGAIEDYVFNMKYENEQREKERRQDRRKRGASFKPPPLGNQETKNSEKPKVMGRAAKILEKQKRGEELAKLSRGHQAKEEARKVKKAHHMMQDDNDKAAQALRESLMKPKEEDGEPQNFGNDNGDDEPMKEQADKDTQVTCEEKAANVRPGSKRPLDDEEVRKEESSEDTVKKEPGVVGEAEDEFDADDDEEEEESLVADGDKPRIEDTLEVVNPEVVNAFKTRVKDAQQKQLDEFSKNVVDNVRLHEAGWRDRYYTDKCKADDINGNGGREHLFRSYVMGLCWVMKYYYDGCASWKWFFPFNYAPFASDLRNIERFEKDCRSFELSTPFNPVEQLMAVLPSDSSHAIPKASRWLMEDEESPIIDFYPKEVPVDPNGKAMPWLWVVLLPFIDEDRLLAAMTPTMTKWTKEELLCNARGLDDGYLYVHRSHSLSKKLSNVLGAGKANCSKTRLTDAAAYDCAGFSGSVRPPLSNELYQVDEDTAISPPSTAGRIDRPSDDSVFADSFDNYAVCVAFSEPLKLSHKSFLLPGTKLRAPVLSEHDKMIRRPRLNRFGGTIANLGTANANSYQSGYGSMNISNYERQLADQTGRGGQMNQAGTRGWGTLEPVSKRHRGVPPPPPPPPPRPQIGNPFMRGPGNQPRAAESPGRPPWQQAAQNSHIRFDQRGDGHGPNRHPGYQHQPMQQGYRGPQGQYVGGNQVGYGRSGQPGPPQNHNPSYQHQRYQQSQHQQHPRYQQQPQQQHHHQQQQGFNFRNYNAGPPPPPGSRPPEPQQRQRASADVINNLRAQLTNTLKNNRNTGRQQNQR